MERSWKNKNPKIKCCNCVFDKTCFSYKLGENVEHKICTYLSIKKYNRIMQADRVRVGFGKSRPKPIALKSDWNKREKGIIYQ